MSGEECQPGSRGSTPGFFDAVLSGGFFEGHRFGRTENRLFLALDDSPGGEGDVYVGDPADNLITKFDSSGRIIGSWGEWPQRRAQRPAGGTGRLRRVLSRAAALVALVSAATAPSLPAAARDPALPLHTRRHLDRGRYADSPGATRMIPGPGEDLFFDLTKVEPTFELPGEILRPTEQHLTEHGVPRYKSVGSIFGGDSGVSYDPLNRTLYASLEGAVSQFSPACVAELESCTPIEPIGAAQLSEPMGVAVDDATGTLYVADYAHHRIAVFSPQPFLPEVPPPSAEGKSTTEETLKGEVDPGWRPGQSRVASSNTRPNRPSKGGTSLVGAPRLRSRVTRPLPTPGHRRKKSAPQPRADLRHLLSSAAHCREQSGLDRQLHDDLRFAAAPARSRLRGGL